MLELGEDEGCLGRLSAPDSLLAQLRLAWSESSDEDEFQRSWAKRDRELYELLRTRRRGQATGALLLWLEDSERLKVFNGGGYGCGARPGAGGGRGGPYPAGIVQVAARQGSSRWLRGRGCGGAGGGGWLICPGSDRLCWVSVCSGLRPAGFRAGVEGGFHDLGSWPAYVTGQVPDHGNCHSGLSGMWWRVCRNQQAGCLAVRKRIRGGTLTAITSLSARSVRRLSLVVSIPALMIVSLWPC
jgi:hypothetical protein